MKKDFMIELETLKNIAVDIKKNDKESKLSLMDLYLTEIELKTVSLPLRERLVIQDKIESLARKGRFFNFISLQGNKLYLKKDKVCLQFLI